MAHDSYLMLISMSFDEELTDQEQDELTQHMRNCAHCAEMWSRMNSFDRMLSIQPMIAPPVDFVANVMRKVEMVQVRRRWTPWMIVMLVVFSILASLSLAWPALFLSVGVKAIASWPVTAVIVNYVAQIVNLIVTAATIATNALLDWLTYLSSNPTALAVVIGALVLVSTYIGLREGLKTTEAYQQQSA